MSQKQKQVFKVNDQKVKKAIQKPFAKQIIECFYKTPLSASEVAEAVSFPKDKIYYHIKKLLALDILFIAETEIVKGIEQNKYLPIAQKIQFDDQEIGHLIQDDEEHVIEKHSTEEKEELKKEDEEIVETDSKSDKSEIVNPLLEKLLQKRSKEFSEVQKTNEPSFDGKNLSQKKLESSEPAFKRTIDDRRRSSDRRDIEGRRTKQDRRIKQVLDYKGEDRRSQKNRRTGKEQRSKSSRREAKDRRLEIKTTKPTSVPLKKHEIPKKESKQSLFLNNAKLHLDGVTHAMTFVHTGNNVTFMQADLGFEEFQIKQVMNYRLPIALDDDVIKTFPDLITAVYEQFVGNEKRGNIYLAIHSSGYQYEMTYVNTEGHKKSDFKDFLLYTLTKSYALDTEKSLVVYNYNEKKENNAIVCYSPYKEYIEQDYKLLTDAGLQPRYNTSIPKILHNIFNYYKTQTGSGNALIIYISQMKTHLILLQDYQLVESRDFSIGLDHFMDPLCKMVPENEITEEDIRNKAMDFLDRYGIALPETKPSELDIFPWDEAQDILNRIGDRLQNEIRSSKNYFSNVRETMGKKTMIIDEFYLGGPGSHIKNIGKLVSKVLESPIKKLEILNTASMKQIHDSKTDLLTQIKERNLIRKKKNAAGVLDEVKKNIMGHKKAIETATSPESVKYRLARLEIDKNSKIKSIEEATEKLIKAATDFKELKDDYTGTQETLTADLETVTSQLDKQSEELLEKYQEHEYLVKQISRMEYESDQFQKKQDEAKRESKGDYAQELKKSANIRVSLAEQKNQVEKKVADQQAEILKGQETLHDMSMRLELGHDEIAVMEYLLDTVDNTSNALRKSFLMHLKSLDRLKQTDLNELEQAGYLLTLNTKRLNGIKQTFTKMVSGEDEADQGQYLDGENGFEIRKKMVSVLNGLLETPGSLDQIKKITADLIKINEDYQVLIYKRDKLQKRIDAKSRTRDKEERKLHILKKDMNVHSRELKDGENQHQNTLAAVDHIQGAMSQIQPLITINEIKKDLQQQQQKTRKELSVLQNQLLRLKSAIVIRKQKIKDLKVNHSERKKAHGTKIKILNRQNRQLIRLEEKLKKLISEYSEKDKDTNKSIKEQMKVRNQFEKQLMGRTKEYKKLQVHETTLVREAKQARNKLQTAFNRKLKQLEKEQDKKTTVADKKRQLKINAFMKVMAALTKKEKLIQNLMASSTSEMQKKHSECDRAKATLVAKKKKIMPKISEWQKQIRAWNRDLKRFYRIQQKFDALEEQHSEWQDLYEEETEKTEKQVKDLEGHIVHKQSDSYLLLVQEGLTRFNNEADAVVAAQELANESIALDEDEIRTVNKAFERLKKRYQTFMKRYRNKRKKILNEFKPYRGREKTIRTRIESAKRKIISAEQVIEVWQDKLDQKNNQLANMEVDFLKLQEKAKQKLSDIQIQIDQAQNKEIREQEIITSDLEDQWTVILEKKNTAENEFLQSVQTIDENLQQQDVIINREKLHNLVLSDQKQLKVAKDQLNKFIQKQKKLQRNITTSQRDLETTQRKILIVKTGLKEEEKRFKVYFEQLKERLETVEKELDQKKENQLTIKEKKHEIELNLRKIKKDYEQAQYESQKQQKKILILIQKAKNLTLTSKRKSALPKKILNEQKQHQILVKMEEKYSTQAASLEKSMQKLDKTVSAQNDQEAEMIKTIDGLKQDIELLNNDFDKTITLMATNRENLSEIGEPHLVILERLNHLKEFYPVTKAMLNERIDGLYGLIDQKTKEKKELDARLKDMEEDLKSRKVDMAMLEKELAKINKNMKKVLEYSVYEQDPTPQAIEITMGDTEYKLRSYMDLAELKARSQDLFEEIIQAEQDVARLQKKLVSIQHVQAETEQISQKKIKRLEEDCTKLELKISKEKNEVEELEKSLKDLAEHTSNYSERIEVLEEELKKFREKETKNELLLRDLDRSLEQIQKKAQQMVMEESKVKENTIELDYMANLGLLMDTGSELNLLPEAHKKEYRYFGINRILQNMLIVLVTVFSLTAYAQRGKIEPLEAGLPDKYTELSLLNVRQDVKQILEKQVMVADAFKVLIDEDKALSANMVATLKYLSNAVPENFKVTNLVLDKDVVGYAMDDSVRAKLTAQDNPMFIISLDGFYSQGMEKATSMVESFKSNLESNNNFKAVFFSSGKAVNKWKTSFSINLML